MCARAAALLFIQIVLSAWAEGKRWADFNAPGSQGDGSFFGITDDLKGTSNGYPGGKLFDPLRPLPRHRGAARTIQGAGGSSTGEDQLLDVCKAASSLLGSGWCAASLDAVCLRQLNSVFKCCNVSSAELGLTHVRGVEVGFVPML